MASPLDRQLEKHIKLSAVDSAHVIFTDHARQRMRQRYINDPVVVYVKHPATDLVVVTVIDVKKD